MGASCVKANGRKVIVVEQDRAGVKCGRAHYDRISNVRVHLGQSNVRKVRETCWKRFRHLKWMCGNWPDEARQVSWSNQGCVGEAQGCICKICSTLWHNRFICKCLWCRMLKYQRIRAGARWWMSRKG